MIYLSDNDIIEKLAVCDLIDDALSAFGAERRDVYVIPTFRLRIDGKKRKRAEARLGGAAVDRILGLLADAQEIREYSPEDHALFDDALGIDAGEAVLLSATGVITGDYRILTGDKKCLRALATQPEFREIARRIAGSVVCFEQVLIRLISYKGFEFVLNKVVHALDRDTAMRAAFGSGMSSTEPNCRACLDSYIAELRALSIDLLMTEV